MQKSQEPCVTHPPVKHNPFLLLLIKQSIFLNVNSLELVNQR